MYTLVFAIHLYMIFFLTESMLTRKTPASYADGVYMMAGQDRPSPRVLSEAFMKGNDGLPSARNRTAMLAFFGEYASISHLIRI